MKNLTEVILHLHPEARPFVNFIVRTSKTAEDTLVKWDLKTSSGTAVPAPTVEEINAARSVLDLQIARKRKLAALALPQTVEVTRGDTSKVTLKSTPAAQAEWMRGWTACQIAAKAGAPDAMMFDAAIGRHITDAADAPIEDVTLGEYAVLMAQLMQAIGTAEAAYAAKVVAINAATTIEELNAL